MKRLGLLLYIFFLCSCGVKGKPLAPLEPEVLGNGLPEYRGAKDMDEAKTTPKKKAPPSEKASSEGSR